MKSKIGKGILIVLVSIVILGVAFFTIDLIRVKQEKNPIFAIPIATYKDGGTKEYLGLGYKVIDYHTIIINSETGYYDDMKMGTWFMKYDVQNPNSDKQTYEFTATILEVGDTYLLIKPEAGETIYSDKVVIGIKQGEKYVEGEIIQIEYDGMVMESYPAQINATSIKVIGNKISQMYAVIIAQLMKEDIALNANMQYIAVDINSFVRSTLAAENINLPKDQKFPSIDETTKKYVIDIFKKYHNTIKQASFKELKEQGLFNEKTSSIEGILITVNEIEELSENKAILRITKYKGGLAAVMPKYELNYQNGQWNIKTIDTMMS